MYLVDSMGGKEDSRSSVRYGKTTRVIVWLISQGWEV